MSNTTQDKPEPSQQPQQQNPPVLEEDDEFEDFPVEGNSLSFFAKDALLSAVHRLQHPTQLLAS